MFLYVCHNPFKNKTTSWWLFNKCSDFVTKQFFFCFFFINKKHSQLRKKDSHLFSECYAFKDWTYTDWILTHNVSNQETIKMTCKKCNSQAWWALGLNLTLELDSKRVSCVVASNSSSFVCVWILRTVSFDWGGCKGRDPPGPKQRKKANGFLQVEW